MIGHALKVLLRPRLKKLQGVLVFCAPGSDGFEQEE